MRQKLGARRLSRPVDLVDIEPYLIGSIGRKKADIQYPTAESRAKGDGLTRASLAGRGRPSFR